MDYSPPPCLTSRYIPQISDALIAEVDPFIRNDRITFACWLPRGEMLVFKQVEGIRQVHYLEYKNAPLFLLTRGCEPVEQVFAKSETEFFFTTCEKGDENYRVYCFDLLTGDTVLVSNFSERCLNPIWSPFYQMLVYSNTLQGQSHLFTRKLDSLPQQLTTVENWWPMDISLDGKFVLAQKLVSNTESYPYFVDVLTKEARPLCPDQNREMLCYQAKWSKDGKGFFHISILNSKHLRLIYTNQQDYSHYFLTEDIYDVEHFSLSFCGTYIAYTLNKDGANELHLLSLLNQEEILPPELPVCLIRNLNFHPSEVILEIELISPESLLTWHVETACLDKWYTSSESVISTQLINFNSFDQLAIPAFYFPPVESLNNQKSPVIISIHGGPTLQSQPVLSPLFRFWRNKFNAAIVLPNIRGSKGYGKAYMDLDDGYLRWNAVKDIGALLDWICMQDELDENRISVYGGSYGGYMVLSSLVEYGQRISCGIDLMGISDLVTFLENTAPYRVEGKRLEYGDERNPEMRTFLKHISPLTHAHKIKSPLFVVHGKNDPRVPAAEASQIVSALEKKNAEVWYALFGDEGHGLTKKDNADYFSYAATLFLQKYL